MTRPTAEQLLRAARIAQEHVARWAATAVAVSCAVAFCIGIGEDSGSTSIGLLFGFAFSAAPGVWLWGREFYEARVRRERGEIAADTEHWTAAADDEDDSAEVDASPWARGGR